MHRQTVMPKCAPDDPSMPMKLIQELLSRVDDWQRQNRLAAPSYGVVKKFGDDGMNQFVVALGWYGFLAIYPLLLVVITIFGFIGVASLGHGIVATLHQFPVIGAQFNPPTHPPICMAVFLP